MKSIVKKILRLLLGDYSAYHVYRNGAIAPAPGNGLVVRQLDADDLRRSPDAEIGEQAFYLGEGAHGFGCFDGDVLAGVCFYWHGQRYLKRNFWPLARGEAKLVQILTLPRMRGRSVAPTLIQESARAMQALGFAHTYARIWHSNTPSLRAFARAGWTRVATVIEVHPFSMARAFRLRLRR
ncbi:GNAT family N-acetyltransferase [Massilia sp. RP-1-19]|uniref:GNAT family N-acetyltransferase n=1 Tax=Massilia polaris TaxID=2728846 RepID=A0A848HGX7_9BURK|nr:GNAT family N-acetyltransferase [Massilia polaris]NML60317.1 GNAT family N-acetyltransferase [Massilia polaris]